MYTEKIRENIAKHLLTAVLVVASASLATATTAKGALIDSPSEESVSLNSEIELLKTQLEKDRVQLREELRELLKKNSDASKAKVKKVVKQFRAENADRISAQNEIAAKIRVLQADFRHVNDGIAESDSMASKEIAFQTVRNIREASTAEAKASAATMTRDAILEWRDNQDFSNTEASHRDEILNN